MSLKKPVSSLDPIVTHCADQAFTNKLNDFSNNEKTPEKEKDCSVILCIVVREINSILSNKVNKFLLYSSTVVQ